MKIQSFRCLSRVAILLIVVLSTHGYADAAEQDANRKYESARQLVFRGQFKQAATGFEQFLVQHPGHPFSSRATFMLGKSKLGGGDETAALKWFERTIKDYPSSLEARKAKFKIAMIDFLNRREDAARKRFQQIVDDADGPYTPEAAAWLRHWDDRPAAPDAANAAVE